jgi:hypothetical protein
MRKQKEDRSSENRTVNKSIKNSDKPLHAVVIGCIDEHPTGIFHIL